MNFNKSLLTGISVVALTALVSFTTKDDHGKKKYHVIHHEGGKVVEYDTVIPMNSNYSVEDFLADKGIESDHVEIVKIPNIQMDDEGGLEKRIFIQHEGSEDVEVKHEEVMITYEIDDDGNESIKKVVNGKEVELTDEELEDIRNGHHGHEADGNNVFIHHAESEDQVELKVEMDEDGNMQIKKTVNGEEVEVTEEELEMIHNHHKDGEHQKIVMIELEEELENLDSLMQELEVEIESIIEEEGNGEHVIIKRIEIDGDEVEGENKEIRKEIRIINDGEMKSEENVTIVLVTENYEE